MELSNIGPIKKLTAPTSWKRSTVRLPQTNHTELPVFIFYPGDSKYEVEIGIFFRGRLESQEDGRRFHELLIQNQSIQTKKSLAPSEIKDLVRTLDLAGFNQYSFPAEKIGYQPDFHLRSAEFLPLNGKTVLRVAGDYLTEGSVDTYFCGIFIDADGTGRKVYEIFLRANDKTEFMRSMVIYKALLSSIMWSQ